MLGRNIYKLFCFLSFSPSSFHTSTGYNEINKQTSQNRKVFYENITVCNNGRARYQLGLVPTKKFTVSEEFAADVCNLPEAYAEKTYLDFIEDWGTVCILNYYYLV